MNVQVYSENHKSRNDTEEEIKYINNNSYDSIVYEHKSGNIPEGYMNRFYHYIFSLPRLLELLIIYDDSSDLIEKIEKSESKLIYTRESNAIFYKQNSFFAHIFSISLFIFLFCTIASFVFMLKQMMDLTTGIIVFLLVSILPFIFFYLILIKTDKYREKEIARIINDQSKGSSILVIIGNNHKEEVINRIESDNIDVLDDK